TLRRIEAEPFADAQIRQLETFADQAVIAIENARLFEELERHNRALSEALEQQTATAEVLRVIASSPADLQPVLDAIVASAGQLTDATGAAMWRVHGDVLRFAAGFSDGTWGPAGDQPEALTSLDRQMDPSSLVGRAAFERRTIRF